MPLNKKGIDQILESIEDYHLVFLADVVGLDFLTKAQIDRLSSKGLLPKKSQNLIQKAYEYGIATGSLPPNTSDLSLDQFQKINNLVTPGLSYDQQLAVDHAKQTAATYIKGVSNTLVKKAHALIVDSDKKIRRSKLVGGPSGIGVRKATLSEIKKGLSAILEDQKRDVSRIAVTEVNNVLQEGRMHAIIKSAATHNETDPFVFKRVAADGCKYCKLLYLDKDGVTPKVFRLSELIDNGSNVGKKAGKPTLKSCGWKACVESVHPWCRCQLQYLAPGFSFDSKGQLVFKGRKVTKAA